MSRIDHSLSSNYHEKPLCIELFAGLHGWAEGFISEQYRVVGFDIVDMIKLLGLPRPKGDIQLVIQDVLTLHGAQFSDAAVIVASPPCQKYSYMAMPWTRAKELAAWYREDESRQVELKALFNACFRIQREANEASGRYIPLLVENVKGAQPWIGGAAWHYGSFYLWGDVPALMPSTVHRKVASALINKRNGHNHTRHLTNQREHDAVKGMSSLRGFSHPNGGKSDLGGPLDPRRFSSKSDSRKAASALIAKIPFELSSHIARCFKPR